MKKLLLLGATMNAALAVGIGMAAANPANNLCGASNMVNANALPGMLNAMGPDFGGPEAHGTGAGNAGMFNAVDLTQCSP